MADIASPSPTSRRLAATSCVPGLALPDHVCQAQPVLVASSWAMTACLCLLAMPHDCMPWLHYPHCSWMHEGWHVACIDEGCLVCCIDAASHASCCFPQGHVELIHHQQQ